MSLDGCPAARQVTRSRQRPESDRSATGSRPAAARARAESARHRGETRSRRRPGVSGRAWCGPEARLRRSGGSWPGWLRRRRGCGPARAPRHVLRCAVGPPRAGGAPRGARGQGGHQGSRTAVRDHHVCGGQEIRLRDEALDAQVTGCGPNAAGSTSLPTVTTTSASTSARPASRRSKRSPEPELKTVPSVTYTPFRDVRARRTRLASAGPPRNATVVSGRDTGESGLRNEGGERGQDQAPREHGKARVRDQPVLGAQSGQRRRDQLGPDQHAGGQHQHGRDRDPPAPRQRSLTRGRPRRAPRRRGATRGCAPGSRWRDDGHPCRRSSRRTRPQRRGRRPQGWVPDRGRAGPLGPRSARRQAQEASLPRPER